MLDAARAPSARSAMLAGLACLVVQIWMAWTTPSIGFAKYTLAVRQWADGTLDAERLVDFSPAYFRLVALVASLTEQPERWLVGLQLLLVAAAVGGVHWLVARRLSPGLAWLGSALLILDRHLLIYSRVLEPEIILLASLVAVAVLLDRSANGPPPRPWRDLAAGLIAGLAIATRPTFLPVFALIPAFHALHGDRGRELVRRSLPFLLALLPGLSLVFGTAWQATGDPRTPVMNPGTVFFEGHHPLSHGTSAIYPPAVAARMSETRGVPDPAHVLYRRIARAEADCSGSTAASIGEVNARWSDLARHHLLADPTVSLRRVAANARYALHSFRWHDLPAAWVLDSRLRLPAVPLAIVSALALLGLIAESRRWREALIFYTLMAIPLAVMVAFYVSARQRLVAIPALVYFALVGIEALRGRRDDTIRPLIALLLVVVLVPLFVWPDDAIRDEVEQRWSAHRFDQALAALRAEGEPLGRSPDEVVEVFASAPALLGSLRPAWIPQETTTLDEAVAEQLLNEGISSMSASRRFDTAALLVRLDRHAEAERFLQPLIAEGFRAYRGGREPSDPRHLLARSLARRGQTDDAVAMLRSILAGIPGEPFVLAELVATTPRAEAADSAHEALRRGYTSADADWLLALAYRAHDRPSDALDALDRLARCHPDWRGVQIQRALALADLRRDDDAVEALVAANRLGAEPIAEPRQVRSLVGRWSVLHEQDPESLWLAARLLQQHGAFQAARVQIEAARALDPPPELLRRLDVLDREIRTLGDPGSI